MGSRSFTKALAFAFNEWLLMLMLFVNSIFSYVITSFADYSELQSPCLICSRFDLILGRKKSHWDMICSKHKSEISSLVYCHAHGKLVDVHGICEFCLLSFAITNNTNSETYRLLFGKNGEDSCFGSENDPITNPRYCTCCNQLVMSQTTTHVAKPELLPKKNVRFNNLPQVGYSELKIQSDTESEAVVSEDEGFVKEEDHKFQTMDLEAPSVITLPCDLVTDRLINLDLTADSLFPEHIPVNDVSETSEKVLKEEEILSLDNLESSTMEHCSDVSKEKEELIHLQDISSPPVLKENPADASLLEEAELICLNDVTLTSETPEDAKGTEHMSLHDVSAPVSITIDETFVEMSKERDTNQADIASLESEDIVVSSTTSMPQNSTENCKSKLPFDVRTKNSGVFFSSFAYMMFISGESESKETKVTSVPEMASPVVSSHTEAALESDTSCFNSMSVAVETNQYSGESRKQGGELLNLADAYNIIVSNEGKKYSTGASQVEKWMKKDTSRVSEDLKALLTQISFSRGIEFMSPRNISSKISVNSTDLDPKNIDYDDMQLLLQRRMLERNESNLSLEGVSVIEIDGESESDRLRRQVDHDRKLLSGLIKELEEERNASAIATNQAMAMITKLQEEKALFQMEALQNLRMMEEQSEYDIEAIQKLNDLVVEREKVIQDLEAEIENFRDQKNNNLEVEDLTEP